MHSSWYVSLTLVLRTASSCYGVVKVLMGKFEVSGSRSGADVGPLVAVHEPQTVGHVRVADEQVGAVGDEEFVVVGAATDAHRRNIGEVVAASPAARDQVVDLETVSAGAAGYPAVPIALFHRAGLLDGQRAAGPALDE